MADVTVGKICRLIDRATGVSGTKHYAIAAAAGNGLAVLGCCDRVDESVMLLSGALQSLTGAAPEISSSPYVVVNRDDLAGLLAGIESSSARDRLRAAARA